MERDGENLTGEPRGRVLVAKLGLDGHDRGVRVVARLLRDAGFEVIYTGLRQTPERVVAAAIDEDVAHLALVPPVLERLRSEGSDIPVVVGGIIPERDVPVLGEAGVRAVLAPGAAVDEIVAVMDDAVASRARHSAAGQ